VQQPVGRGVAILDTVMWAQDRYDGMVPQFLGCLIIVKKHVGQVGF
jgi:hypothetical protein